MMIFEFWECDASASLWDCGTSVPLLFKKRCRVTALQKGKRCRATALQKGKRCRATAVQKGGFKYVGTNKERALGASLFSEDILYERVRKFNPEYKEPEGALTGLFRHLQTNIYGNRDFLKYLRNQGTFFSEKEKRELNLKLIDY